MYTFSTYQNDRFIERGYKKENKYSHFIRHTENDMPSIDFGDQKSYHFNGVLHRTDGPAQEGFQFKHWYLNDKLHRENGPAIERSGGFKVWLINGELHNENGHALEFINNNVLYKFHYLNGILVKADGKQPSIFAKMDNHDRVIHYKDKECTIVHNDSGPAVILAGADIYWYANGVKYLEERSDGTKYWWIGNQKFSTEKQYQDHKQAYSDNKAFNKSISHFHDQGFSVMDETFMKKYPGCAF